MPRWDRAGCIHPAAPTSEWTIRPATGGAITAGTLSPDLQAARRRPAVKDNMSACNRAGSSRKRIEKALEAIMRILGLFVTLIVAVGAQDLLNNDAVSKMVKA